MKNEGGEQNWGVKGEKEGKFGGMDHEDSAHTRIRVSERIAEMRERERRRGEEKASKWEEDPRVWKSLGTRV